MTGSSVPQATSPGNSAPPVYLQVLADYRYLNVVSACLAAVIEGVDAVSERDTVIYGVQLAVHEACVNIVDHAYSGQIGKRGHIGVGISLGEAPRQLVVDLYDEGRPFDAPSGNRLSDRSLPGSEDDLREPQVHGYGLFLMQRLVDNVQYERIQDRNHWTLSKKL